ncbi:ATP-binding response regulator [Paraburkholderia sp. D1E]|uniref:ATP-binding response regulator n=1 Tax=Paraburkholderia sp. D1E TaxID=3461398 RepID=UPI004045AAB5
MNPQAAPMAVTPSPYADQIFAAQMAALRRNFPVALAGSLLTVGLIVVVLDGNFPLRELLGWFAANAFVTLTRTVLVVKYERASRQMASLRRWERSIRWCTTLAGALWGLPYAYWLFHAPFEHQMFLIIGLLTLGTGAIYAYCIHLPLLYAFEVPYFIPSFVALALLPGTIAHALGLAGVLYLGVTFAFAHRMYRTQLDSLRIRFENTDLLQRLAIEKEAAERSNLAKSQFLASASHDLRQPVHALSLYVGVLREEKLNAKSRQLVDHIGRATAAMGSLFDGLLNISRLDAGVIKPRRRHFPIGSLLDQIQREYAPQAAAHRLILRLRCPGAPVVHSDPVLLDRILRNLVDNAIRHTRQGGALIACRHRGANLHVEVWDTGVGIAPEEHESIFLEFRQLSNPERDRNKGLGLGLAIVRRTADLLGHPLELRSRPGRGSVFAITLPIGETTAAAPLSSPADTDTDTDKQRSRGQLIFIVEDDADNRHGLRLLLETWGYRVMVGSSGDDILQATVDAAEKPALILCDFRLRDHETGIEVIDRLHEEYADDTIPALLISGDTDPSRLIEASARAWPLLHKPVDSVYLRSVITQLLAPATLERDGNTV